ncbi:MAG: hypothetical protein M1821_007238 [Bathelium mastoideum]|nr:MAG: hypothetical protein M1821_007238 [Bathelium mastoideum]
MRVVSLTANILAGILLALWAYRSMAVPAKTSLNATPNVVANTSQTAQGVPAATPSGNSSSNNPSTNSSGSPADAGRTWVIMTNAGTTLDQLQALITKYALPKDGNVFEYRLGGGYWYTVNITQAKAYDVGNDPIVCGVSEETFAIFDRATPKDFLVHNDLNKRVWDRPSRDPNLWRRIPAANHLSLLSRDTVYQRARNFPGMLYDPALGTGSTIYVVDTGANLDHAEFKNRPGPLRSWTAPNVLTGGTEPEDARDWYGWDDQTHTYTGHGTGTASVAGGNTLSYAPKAELVIVKISNGVSTPNGVREANTIPRSYAVAFDWIIDDVKNNPSRQRKTVVTIQSTFTASILAPTDQDDYITKVYMDFVANCRQLGIVVVITTGNSGDSFCSVPAGSVRFLSTQQYTPGSVPCSQDHYIPQRLGGDQADLITIGGVEPDGTLYYPTTPKMLVTGGGGSISAYAQADRVTTASNVDDSSFIYQAGTSFAGPTIAGLIAYWFSVPLIYDTLSTDPRQFIADVKTLLQNGAYSRFPPGQMLPPYTPILNYASELPQQLPVPINRAWKSWCPAAPGSHTKRGAGFITDDEAVIEERAATSSSSSPPADLPVVINGSAVETWQGFSLEPDVQLDDFCFIEFINTDLAKLDRLRYVEKETPHFNRLPDADTNTSTPSNCPRFPSHDVDYTSSSFDNSTALKQWMIVSAWDVSMDWFDTYVAKYNETGCFNTYTRTNHFPNFNVANMFLTVQDAKSISKNTNISAIGLSTMNVTADSVEERAGTPYGANPQLDLLQPAAPQLQILSRNSDNYASLSSEGYLHDPSLGEGISVYVLDSGYNSDHEEFKNRPLNNLYSWSAPPIHDDEEGVLEDFESGGSDYDANIFWDEMNWNNDEGYYVGHGTAVASIIGGATIGVVPRADLHILRWTVPVKSQQTQRYEVPTSPDPAHLSDAMEYIIDDVKQSGMGPSKNKKAVINFSYTIQIMSGERVDENGFTRDISLALWENFVQQCTQNEIVLVVGTGNWGNYWYNPDTYPPSPTKPTGITNPKPYSLDFAGPQCLGTDDNELITVGGIEFNGTLYFRTTPKVSANGGSGSVTIYALADNVKKARNARLQDIPGANEQTKIGFDLSGGTSLAAPSVSGLIAYFLALDNPGMDEVKNSPNFNLAMKQKLVDMGHQLNTQTPLYGPGGAILNFPQTDLNYADDVPTSLLVAYNGAYEGLCVSGPSSSSRVKRDNNTSPSNALKQELADIKENIDNINNVNATVSNIPIVRNHQFYQPIADFNMTGCMCLSDKNNLQDGINCTNPLALNSSQTMSTSGWEPSPLPATSSSASQSSSSASSSSTSQSSSSSASSTSSDSTTSSTSGTNI